MAFIGILQQLSDCSDRNSSSKLKAYSESISISHQTSDLSNFLLSPSDKEVSCGFISRELGRYKKSSVLGEIFCTILLIKTQILPRLFSRKCWC